MLKTNRRPSPTKGKDLISLAQQLARDAERHAILSASLASQADRLMVAGLRLARPPRACRPRRRPRDKPRFVHDRSGPAVTTTPCRIERHALPIVRGIPARPRRCAHHQLRRHRRSVAEPGRAVLGHGPAWAARARTGSRHRRPARSRSRSCTLTPASQPVIGVQWVQGASDRTCNGGLLQVNQFATANSTAISGQIISGAYCIIMYDSVGLTLPANYSITVSHP